MTVSDVRPATDASPRPYLTGRVRTGLVLCILLGLAGAVPPGGGSNGPPVAVEVLDALLGVVQVVSAIVFWRSGNRLAVRIAAGALILNAITALPAFFVDVDAWVKVLVAVAVLLTVLTVVLILGRPKSTGLR